MPLQSAGDLLTPDTSPLHVARSVARALADMRAAAGETQRQLAERIGTTESVISRLESGTHVPNLATLCRIAEGFGRRLGVAFHEHEHEHTDGVRHKHVHGHDDFDHMHDHEGA